jgi:hypothetical protein
MMNNVVDGGGGWCVLFLYVALHVCLVFLLSK